MMICFLKKNKLAVLVASAYLALAVFHPEKALGSLQNSVYYLKEMLQILPVVFLLTAVIEALVPRQLILRGLGAQSGWRGNLLALLLGSVSAGPIYAAFPIGKALLKKGASISNLVIILSAWAVIKVPMLANEAKFLGLRFMVFRWVLTVPVIFLMAFLSGKLVTTRDIPTEEGVTSPRALEVIGAYCIGCGLCAKLMPECIAMKDGKAVLLREPEGEEAVRSAVSIAAKCPGHAMRVVENPEKNQNTL